MVTLGHLLPGPLAQADGKFAFEGRLYSGLMELARLWSGTVVVLSPAGEASVPAGAVMASAAETPFEVVTVEREPAAVDAIGLDLMTALHAPHMAFATKGRTPVVLTSEVTPAIRRGIHAANLSGVKKARAVLGLARMEAGLLRQMRAARSAQFNGPAAHDAYARMVEDPLLYHDHRVLAADVAEARQVDAWAGDRPLRIGFSGRWDRMKGPHYAVRLARAAHAAGMPVELHMFGGGPLAGELRDEASPNVVFRGFRDFRTQWLPEVREEIDIMALTHVQGDPSCTYLEALGSGAPVLGFENPSLRPLVKQHGVGWAVPMRDEGALFTKLQELLSDPAEVARARTNGLDLVEAESFEVTTARRVSHLARMT